jgi:hypothetical protein
MRPHELQSKRHYWKNYKLIIHIVNNFFYNICDQLANKTRNLLFAIHLLIYIIYGIIGFVGLVANLLNRTTDGATVSVRKSASEKNYRFH